MKQFMDLRDDRSEKVRYNNPDFPAYVRRGILSDYPNYAAVSHWHDDIELIAVLSGHMSYNVNGCKIILEEGNGIFVNSRQVHYGFSEDFSECEFICVLLHPLLLCTSQYVEREFITPVLTNESFPCCRLDHAQGWQNEILDSVRAMFSSLDDATMALQIQSLFFAVWKALCEHIPPRQENIMRPGCRLSSLRDMIGYIQKHYSEKITLSEIAAQGNMCKSSCSAVFQKFLNQTPVTYLNEYRLKKSIDYLRSTDMTITEISCAAGFSNPSYYAETFRRFYGCSPKDYRKAKQK